MRLASTGSAVEDAWALTAERERRLHPGGAPVLADEGAPVVATIDDRMDADAAVVEADGEGWSVTAGSPLALQRGFTALAAGRPVPGPGPVRSRGGGCTSTWPASSSPPRTSTG